MSVTISSAVFWADWPNSTDTTFQVRAKSNRAWISEEQEIIPAGESRIVGSGTIAASRPTLPAITLPSTSAGLDDQTAKWTVTLHRTGKTQVVSTVLADFPLPDSFEPSTTWAAIKINKNGKQPLRDTSVYTKIETNHQISLAVGTLNDASASVKGRTKLSVAPVLASDPIAVGNNDPRVLDISNYASFAAMISAIGSTQYTFNIHGNINVTANATVPANITLRFLQGGRLTLTTGVTLIIRGPVIADPVKIFYNALASQGTISFSANKKVQDFYAEWWGATVDGSTDDSASVQAMAVAMGTAGGGTWVFPIGTIAIGTTVAFLGAGTENYLSIRGNNPVNCKLNWIGATTGRLIDISFNKFFKVEGVGFYNGVAKGTTIGVHLTGPNTSGTQTLGGIFERVIISGFDVGMLAGAYTGKATSEILYSQLYIQSNNTGWKNQDLNTLDHVFLMLLMSGNAIGLDINSGNAYVYGGSASNQTTTDFKLTNAFQSVSIRDFRSETQNRFMTETTSGNGGVVQVENVLITNPTNADKISFDLGMGNTNFTLDTVFCGGKVYLSDVGAQTSFLQIRNSKLRGDTTIPIFFNAASASNNRLQYEWRGNVYYDEGASATYRYNDEDGEFIGVTRYPNRVLTRADALFNFNQLRIKSLSQGTISTGKNLRGQETFATAATKAVVFARTVSNITTTNGSSSIQFASGALTFADIGRKIVLTAAANGGGDVTGFIVSLDAPTSATIQAIGNGIGVTSAAITGTIGENEPDANYTITGTGNVDERFWITGKATTGFTINSSNATSTAIYDWHLIR